MHKIVVIEDDRVTQSVLKTALSEWGYQIILCSNGEEGLNAVYNHQPQIVITDFQMPGMNGIEVIQRIKAQMPNIPLILMTSFDEVQITIKAIQAGAFDYIEKPINLKKLKAILNQAFVETNRVVLDVNQTQIKVIPNTGVNLIGKSDGIREVVKKIGLVSNNRVSILILGETGTGKEVVAKIIHESGVTRNRPFVAVNCSALAESLLESELFGHVKGAFTDAIRDKAGKFESAADGTIFLDEISEISPSIQLKLLRVIQESEFERVGGEKTISMNARIIAATNKPLDELVLKGKFRQDLYYRLNVFSIEIPPLRERMDDIPLLVDYFIQKTNQAYLKNIKHITKDALEMLIKHHWHGNIRELEHTITRAILICNSDTLDKSNIQFTESKHIIINAYNPYRSLKDVEKEHIEKLLEALDWKKEKVANILEISRPTLNQKIEQYGIVKKH